MASSDNSDPIGSWFDRHRVKLAIGVLAVILLGRLPDLLDGTARGILGFVYAAAFFGLLTWGWGTRQDRSEASYWRKFALLWTGFLVVQLALVTFSLARGNEFEGRWLVPIGVAAVLVIVHWLPYRRIRSGKAFPVRSGQRG